jgi:hypothetical protein
VPGRLVVGVGANLEKLVGVRGFGIIPCHLSQSVVHRLLGLCQPLEREGEGERDRERERERERDRDKERGREREREKREERREKREGRERRVREISRSRSA